MSDTKGKTPLQANGASSPTSAQDDAGADQAHVAGGGESQGGAYPNPHTGKEKAGESEGFHGGQSETAYHGTGQLGEDNVKGQKNLNSPAKD